MPWLICRSSCKLCFPCTHGNSGDRQGGVSHGSSLLQRKPAEAKRRRQQLSWQPQSAQHSPVSSAIRGNGGRAVIKKLKQEPASCREKEESFGLGLKLEIHDQVMANMSCSKVLDNVILRLQLPESPSQGIPEVVVQNGIFTNL